MDRRERPHLCLVGAVICEVLVGLRGRLHGLGLVQRAGDEGVVGDVRGLRWGGERGASGGI